MTELQFEYLKKFEENFYTALERNRTSAVGNTDRKRLSIILEQLTGEYINPNCSKCLLKIMQILGKLYNEELNKSAIKEEIEEPLDTEKAKPKKVKKTKKEDIIWDESQTQTDM